MKYLALIFGLLVTPAFAEPMVPAQTTGNQALAFTGANAYITTAPFTSGYRFVRLITTYPAFVSFGVSDATGIHPRITTSGAYIPANVEQVFRRGGPHLAVIGVDTNGTIAVGTLYITEVSP